MSKASDPYAQPEWYDLLHAPGTMRDAAALLRVARRFVGADAASGAWLECGCGTGRYGFALQNRGVASFVGVDLHPAMVAYARRRAREERGGRAGRRVRFVLGDMRTLRGLAAGGGRSAGLDAAFCLDNSIRHLSSDAAMAEHLRAVRRVLSRTGVYIVGLGLRPEGGDSPSEHISLARRRGVTVHSVANFLPPEESATGRAARMERCFIHTTVSARGASHEHLSRYGLRTWTPEQWKRAVRAGGMREIGVVDDRARDLGEGRTGYAYRVLANAVSTHHR